MTGIPKPLYWRVLAVTIVVSIGGFVGVIWYVGKTAAAERERALVEIQQLCGVLYAMVDRSRLTIGKKGTQGYAYYREHPDELRVAKREIERALRELPCSPPKARGPTGPVGPVPKG